jgi:hypothetical protein
MLLRRYLFLCMTLLWSAFSISQGTNTPCSGGVPAATVLTPATTCTPSNGTTVGAAYATNAANGGTPTCALPGAPDVWFMFTAPAGGNVTITTGAGTITDSGMSLYSGSCGSFTQIACDDDSGPGTMSQITSTTLTAGTTYFIRVWAYESGTGTFTICVVDNSVACAAPANDDPCAATAVTVGTSCTFTQYTNACATATAGAPAPGCASYAGGDVWFTATVPASGSLTFDSNTGVMTDGGMAIYSGTCGALTLIACDDDNSTNGSMPIITQTGLTPGATIWIRFWEYGNNNNGTFSLCVWDPGGACSAPANDDPCSATAITVGASCTFTQYTNACATATAGAPAPGCASYSGGDVWFTATVPASGALSFDSNTGVVLDGGMAVYSGTCGSLTLIDCDDDNSTNGAMPSLTLGGLTPGATVWIRMWEYGNNNNGTFSLCAWDPGAGCTVPANDNPCTATAVTVGTSCTYTQYTNACATATAGPPAPGCAGYSGGDVWFTATVPAGGELVFNTNTGVILDGGMAIYSGTCAALTLIDCDDDGSTNGAMPMIQATGLTPGATIWIRVWEYSNDNNGTFSLCVTEPPPPPTNTDCGSMEPICSDTPITFTAGTGAADAEIVDPGNNYGCLSTSPNPTWFYLELLTDGTISIDISAGSDVDFALWGPYADLTDALANCNNYPAPIDCSYSSSATEQVNYTPALANQVYVLLVTNYADVTQVIDLNSGAGNTALTDCSIILPIELLNLYVTVEDASNTLHWTTQSELSNDYFIVERSNNGSNFSEIGIVDGAGNSSVENSYQFQDRDFTENITYYRIKQVDFDGTEKSSMIVSVNRDAEQVVIYPNPTNHSITLDFPKNVSGNFELVYRGAIGREFSEQITITAETTSYTSDVFEQLPSGLYFVEIRSSSGELISVQKVLKAK